MVSISFNSLKGSHEVDIFETSAWGEENFFSWQPINREFEANLNESKQQPLITYSQWLWQLLLPFHSRGLFVFLSILILESWRRIRII